MTTCSVRRRKKSARRSWAATCSAVVPEGGATSGGRAGGETTHQPFHPVFVLTHHAREPLVMQGGTTFFFVTDGIESALEQAKKEAGARDVVLGGGAKVAQQYLSAGLMDEMELHVVPLLLGGGERLLDNLRADVKLEPVRTLEGPGVTHLKYRVIKKG
jgi:dihydrofolate reductase